MDDGGPTAVSSTLKSGTQPVCVDPSLLTAALSMNGVGGGQAGGVAATLSPTQQALLASTLQQQQPQPLATPLAVPAATAALSPALTAVLPAAGAAAGAPALLAPALLSTAVPTVVPPTPAVLAALAAATEPAAAVNKAASVILLGPEQDTTARAPAPAAVGANQIAASPAGAQASAAAAEAEAAEAAAAADSMPDIPDPLDSQLATSPIGAAAADALAAALAASAAAQQQQQQQQEQEQLQQQQQAQVQQLLVHQEQMRQQMAQHQQQQAMLSAAMSPPSTTTAALTAELTAAGFTPAAAALAAQQQQQIQAQQQQLQQQQQMMASAGLTTATALVPTGAKMLLLLCVSCVHACMHDRCACRVLMRPSAHPHTGSCVYICMHIYHALLLAPKRRLLSPPVPPNIHTAPRCHACPAGVRNACGAGCVCAGACCWPNKHQLSHEPALCCQSGASPAQQQLQHAVPGRLNSNKPVVGCTGPSTGCYPAAERVWCVYAERCHGTVAGRQRRRLRCFKPDQQCAHQACDRAAAADADAAAGKCGGECGDAAGGSVRGVQQHYAAECDKQHVAGEPQVCQHSGQHCVICAVGRGAANSAGAHSQWGTQWRQLDNKRRRQGGFRLSCLQCDRLTDQPAQCAWWA